MEVSSGPLLTPREAAAHPTDKALTPPPSPGSRSKFHTAKQLRAATRLQAATRGLLARRDISVDLYMPLVAATLIQAHWRAHSGTTRPPHVLKIQAAARGMLARAMLRPWRMLRSQLAPLGVQLHDVLCLSLAFGRITLLGAFDRASRSLVQPLEMLHQHTGRRAAHDARRQRARKAAVARARSPLSVDPSAVVLIGATHYTVGDVTPGSLAQWYLARLCDAAATTPRSWALEHARLHCEIVEFLRFGRMPRSEFRLFLDDIAASDSADCA